MVVGSVPLPVTEKHELTETEFLVDTGGHLTAPTRHEFSGDSTIELGTTSKVVPDCHNTNRSLPHLLAGQLSEHQTVGTRFRHH